MTANIRYVLDAKLDSVDYIGRKVDKIAVALAKTTTSAAGALSVTFTAPSTSAASTTSTRSWTACRSPRRLPAQRKVTISPTRGPIGTPITIKVVGMGSPTYESVGSVLYDNRFTGSLAANTTRGVVTFKLRAAETSERTGSSTRARVTPCHT